MFRPGNGPNKFTWSLPDCFKAELKLLRKLHALSLDVHCVDTSPRTVQFRGSREHCKIALVMTAIGGQETGSVKGPAGKVAAAPN